MDADIVVIGAGVNGLGAAALLASQGKRVVVLEANEVAGGAIRTEEVTLPGFRHDLFAMNLGLFAGGPINAALGERLAAHGLEFVPSAKPFCSVFPDGTMLGVEADVAETVANIAEVAPEDVESWQELTQYLGEIAPTLIGVLGSDMPSWGAAKALWSARRKFGTTGVLDIAKLALSSTRAFTEEHFASPKVRALMASWGMHLDFAPDISGGALFSFLETIGGQFNGMVIGRGGADCLVNALVAVIEESGGQVLTGERVTEIVVENGKASGVRTESGTHHRAQRAVIANVNPRLLPPMLGSVESARPNVSNVKSFRPGLATMMLHLALDELPDWRASRAREFNYVHIGPYLDDMAMTYTQAAAGRLPDSPTLVVGQPTISDPTRAPEGRHTLWVQVRVLPSHPDEGSWDDIAEAYADRVIDKIEEYAPGLRSHILARKVLSPVDLERANANLIGGDSLGGSHHPAQFFFLRPVPGWWRHRSPVDRLFICGASTWPGGGVGGGSGALVAQALR